MSSPDGTATAVPAPDAEQLIAEVAAGPSGPEIGAFFDFDGTLIDGYSLNAFARYHLRSMDVSPLDAARLLLLGLRGVASEADFEEFFTVGMRAWAGRSEDELTELGERLFVQGIAGSLYPEAWRLVAAHQRAGHTVVFASSATRFQVGPAAHAMGVSHLLVTPVEIENGICTGRPGGPPLWRSGKAAAVRSFAAEHGIDLAKSYAYSNGDEDVPFLQTAGRPHALNPERGLAAEAAKRGWPVTRFAPRGRSGLGQVVRTVATAAGMLGGFGAGLALGGLTGSRRTGIDLGTALAGDLGSALAGIGFDVRGAEHLVSPRPAVFLFNHQSALDVLVLAKLLRGGFTGVAKKEAANTPGFGLIFRLADVAFVDRGNTTQAKAALEPAVQRLREGISLVIAPEGTRSVTPALGPFKKGAFHVAMQAGVPIVPVVIFNAGELMWRGASTVRSGTVKVVVHPPIPTDGWRVDELDKHVEQVRDLYLDTLGEAVPPPTRAAPSAAPDRPAPPGTAAMSAPREWGTAAQMNPLETVMWRAEGVDRRLCPNVTLLELLDREPDWARLYAAHQRAALTVPRMRQRVVEPPLGLGPPRWAPADELDLDRHLGRVELAAPGGMRELLDLAQGWARAPLDRDRPLWAALLVTGLAGGRAGYLVKTHHSVTDGLGAVQLMARLHSRTGEPTTSLGPPPDPRAAGAAAPRSGARRGGPGVAEAVGALLHPQAMARRLLDTGRALAQAAAPAGPRSPLLVGRSGAWRFDVLDVELARLKAAAKAAGGSVNDGFVAGLLGGFRRYHEAGGSPVDSMPVAIPISLRTEDDPMGGNRFTAARFSAPVAEPDPAARIDAVREFVVTARSSAALDAVPLLAPALAQLPAPLVARVSAAMTSANDLQASNFPGVPYPVYIAGARITHMYPFGPLPGCAAMITMISHDGTCCVGVNTDPAAVTDAALLAECLADGFAEVLALAVH